jgi:hypothetical protein
MAGLISRGELTHGITGAAAITAPLRFFFQGICSDAGRNEVKSLPFFTRARYSNLKNMKDMCSYSTDVLRDLGLLQSLKSRGLF